MKENMIFELFVDIQTRSEALARQATHEGNSWKRLALVRDVDWLVNPNAFSEKGVLKKAGKEWHQERERAVKLLLQQLTAQAEVYGDEKSRDQMKDTRAA